MSKYVAAIDQGTTSTRCIIFDHGGNVIAVDQREHQQIYPKPGWVEHDGLEIWERTQEVMKGALANANCSVADIASIGVTNQRETTLVWDRVTGKPIYNAIVWQDTRTDAICNELAKNGGQDRLRSKTGLPLATYFSGPKIKWILDNVEGARAKAKKGELMFGNMDTSSSEEYGKAKMILEGVPVSGDLGDQQAALFGQTCYSAGEAKNTYGTGCFMLMNMGEIPVPSKSGLLTTLGYKIGNQKAVYALEGSIAIAGALIQWLRDNLGLIQSSAEVEALANSVEDNGGIYFVPAFSGLYAPYWKSDARGVIAGMTRYVTKAHIARAALEATAFQTREVLDAMEMDSGVKLKALKVDGGMVYNELLMQFQSDILDVPVVRPKVAETTALGAAYAAGLAVGFWKDYDELRANWGRDREWTPKMDAKQREGLYSGWKKAVTRTFDWVE